jgi:hypothetical protein
MENKLINEVQFASWLFHLQVYPPGACNLAQQQNRVAFRIVQTFVTYHFLRILPVRCAHPFQQEMGEEIEK